MTGTHVCCESGDVVDGDGDGGCGVDVVTGDEWGDGRWCGTQQRSCWTWCRHPDGSRETGVSSAVDER